MVQDPFRRNPEPLTGDALSEALRRSPVSRDLGFEAGRAASRITGMIGGYLEANRRETFDRQREIVWGPSVSNMLTAEEANATRGLEGQLEFDGPVNRHVADWMRDQTQQRLFNEEMQTRAGLSFLDRVGAGFMGGITDPVQWPLLLLGGEAALLRGLGVAAKTTTGAVLRGTLAGAVDGVTASVVYEGINSTVRNASGEDYGLDESLVSLGVGIVGGGTVGGVTGGVAGRATSRAAQPARRVPRRNATQARVADLINAEATRRGENPSTALRIAEIESGLNPRADNPRSTASGVYQFIARTWRGMGGGDVFDERLNVERGIELLAQNRQTLRRELGRDPQEWELYLAHQQGSAGAIEILRDPNRPAVDALRAAGVADPDAAIRLNGGRAGMTAGQFARKWQETFGDGGGDAPPGGRPPSALNGMTDNERAGSLLLAVNAVNRDEPLDLAPFLLRDGTAALDETTAAPTIRGRWLDDDVAVTRSGGELPVRFAVVELADLRTSHSDDLTANADYPELLQPRDRSRPGAVAENYNLERDLNPRLLMRDQAAAGGAPIISPDGIVESGNGRTIALRRSAATGTEAWQRYSAELARQGVDTTGFEQPVLVRMRTQPMTGQARSEMTRALNVSPTEAFSPVEQARSDARRLDRATLGLIDGDDAFAPENRPFLKGFVQRVAPNDANALTDARGAISAAGKARVQAALVQAAYGDDILTAALFETADPSIRVIGQALADAAPGWARMRAEAPRGMDMTESLTTAVGLIREARSSRIPLAQLLEERLAQVDLLSGETLSPDTGAFVRLMFRDDGLRQPRSAGAITEALRTYARTAAETPAGPDLFGNTPNGNTFLENAIARIRALEGDGSRGLAYAGGGEPLYTGRQIEAPVLDLRPAERQGGNGGGAGLRPQDGGGAGAGGREPGERPPADLKGPPPLPPELASDPEYAALVADTEALARQSGIETPDYEPSERPETWAAAIRAAAVCLTSDFDVAVEP